jgi:hypothetical protein
MVSCIGRDRGGIRPAPARTITMVRLQYYIFFMRRASLRARLDL